jgi:hypothetical protein
MARRIGAWVNARLKSTANMTDRRDVLNNLKAWTAEGLTVNGEDNRSGRFFLWLAHSLSQSYVTMLWRRLG